MKKKPTLEDLIRMIVRVRARMEKENITLRVTIESYAIAPAPLAPKAKRTHVRAAIVDK